ncbi:MAG: hypothetical protein OXL96_21165 [Candidatus Poribacteria bacterium]|nr:hypothetical protein [Candidatus Poribacteria bacterium]
MIHEKKYNPEKQMTLETDASKLTTHLQQVNPDVTLETVKALMDADDETKEKVYLAYSLNQTQSWVDNVRSFLKI